MGKTEFWHNDPAFTLVADSYLTGHAVHANIHQTKFLVPPTWTPEGVDTAVRECRAEWADLKSFHRPSPKLQPFLDAFAATCGVPKFGRALDALFAERPGWGRNAHDVDDWGGSNWRYTDKTRIMELMVGIWRHHAIAWPIGDNPFPKQHYTRTAMFGPAERIVTAFLEATPGRNRSFMRNTIVPLLLQRAGVQEAGDLTSEVVRDDLRRSTAMHQRRAAKAILVIQRAAEGDLRGTDAPDDFSRSAEGAAERGRFAWATGQNPALETWCAYGAAWLAEATAGKTSIVTTLNTFFKYLLANPHLPTDPRDFLNIRTKLDPAPVPVRRQVHQKTAEFLEWVLDCRLSDDVDGVRVRPPTLRNPLTKVAAPRVRHSESVREAMPTLLVQMLLDILTEDDWRWARKFAAASKQGGDWFVYQDEQSSQFLRVWAPVRAVAIWMKLRMPFRTFQIRMLDSGEADTFAYDTATGQMVPNTGPLRTGTGKAPVLNGVVQLRRDARVSRDVPILRISTNKTADLDTAADDRGYDCPYAPADVVRMLAWLRDWQATHNPVAGPTPWSAVPELAKTKTAGQLAGRKACFLFRNPVGNAPPALPIANSWMHTMWAHLLRELEVRLADQGIVSAGGLPYRLVEVARDAVGRVKITPVYDLHSMRVTLITAYYEAGVPAEILMKIVGHATIVMTLYYTKIGVASVSEHMEAGHEQMIRQTQQNWVHHQQSVAFRELRNAVAWNEEAGPAAFAEGSGASFVFMDVGICPVGCARCGIGGPKLTADKPRSTDYAPAHCNARRPAAAHPPARRATRQRGCAALDAERRAAVAGGQPFMCHREWQKTGTDLDDATDALDQLLLQMNSLARLIEQSRRILSEEAKSELDSTALVVNDTSSLETVFEETTEFDLLDRICQSSTLFQSVDPTGANLRRMRAYDRMLSKNGLQPAFLDLDEATALAVGNQLSRLFMARIGRANTLNLLNGTETLARLGFDTGSLADELSGMARRRSHLQPHALSLLDTTTPADMETA